MREPGMRARVVLASVIALWAMKTATAGDALYYSCQSCHEQDGSGNEAIGAPAIAGMNADYVATQMRKFRDGIRGASIDDLPGRQMNLIASLITDDAEIRAVADYVASMKKPASQRTISVKIDTGADLFAPCAVCHGGNGGGNNELGAPAIAELNDWYVRSQLTRFRDGGRGAHPDDRTGAQMKAAVAGLSDETILVLSAYTATLGQELETTK